ncbi:hypothetical protein CORC01_04846 [Colletotrichum orchidophilum]|uniref:Uncharacterized protein n=1 Tax=Colletotrichum orchidophilum TaxID=1209926 RepID=A0A1G4BF18_9PEZI|nr:uncharacterized protein CORC01_04846 [Colletotrichum orchidophilum]OHE99945.1 hypothetical protein CORC01_04846 [Colletotrichum orchidophilum]
MASSFSSTSKTGDAPPPPPPPPVVKKAPTPLPAPKPPTVASKGPPGAFLVELLVYNGSPFKDHCAYFVCSHRNRDTGVRIHATGDVRNGFEFNIERSHNFDETGNYPTTRIPLQWVNAQHFDEKAMLNHGSPKIDTVPVCGFEVSVNKAKAPGKTLNSVEDTAFKTKTGKKIIQNNCQSWLVESADFLVQDRIFNSDVAVYLHAIEQ